MKEVTGLVVEWETPSSLGEGMDEDIGLEEIDWDLWSDTSAALERDRVDAGEPWTTSDIAGLQYYDYWKPDGLDGVVRPQVGDRLYLVREPTNRADRNAIQVRWKNAYMIGHLPREVASELAEKIDAGEPCRAYVWKRGNGEKWSARVWMVGAACADLHNWRVTRLREREEEQLRFDVRDASEQVWGRAWYFGGGGDLLQRDDPTGHEPTNGQEAALRAFERERWVRRVRREADLIYALNLMQLPYGALTPPDPGLRGNVFKDWDEVPPWLTTKGTMEKYRRKPAGKSFATMECGSGRKLISYSLYAYAESAEMQRAPPEAAAQAAEAAFLRKWAPAEDDIPF